MVKIIEILEFSERKQLNKNQVNKKQEFSSKEHLCITLKKPKR